MYMYISGRNGSEGFSSERGAIIITACPERNEILLHIIRAHIDGHLSTSSGILFEVYLGSRKMRFPISA